MRNKNLIKIVLGIGSFIGLTSCSLPMARYTNALYPPPGSYIDPQNPYGYIMGTYSPEDRVKDCRDGKIPFGMLSEYEKELFRDTRTDFQKWIDNVSVDWSWAHKIRNENAKREKEIKRRGLREIMRTLSDGTTVYYLTDGKNIYSYSILEEKR